MRFIRKLFEWALLLIIGFLIGLFFGPQIIDEVIPSENAQSIERTEKNPDVEQTSWEKIPLTDFLSPSPDKVDEALIETQIYERVNRLRTEHGLNRVEKNTALKEAASIRAIETEEAFSHTRPNGEEPFTVLQEIDNEYFYEMVGENLAMATFIQDEEYMSELIMDGWIDSPDHYQTMINPDYDEIGIGIHYNGEILYITQFFGTQR